jgi:iron-sulfur cluster assembly protein
MVGWGGYENQRIEYSNTDSGKNLMLTLTDGAAQVIRTLTSQPELPAETGLRITARDEDMATFQLAVTEGPVAGDQVIEAEGARVFLEPTAATALDDKALDAQVNDEGDVAFSVSEQA